MTNEEIKGLFFEQFGDIIKKADTDFHYRSEDGVLLLPDENLARPVNYAVVYGDSVKFYFQFNGRIWECVGCNS